MGLAKSSNVLVYADDFVDDEASEKSVRNQ